MMMTLMTKISTNPYYCVTHVTIVSVVNNLDRLVLLFYMFGMLFIYDDALKTWELYQH